MKRAAAIVLSLMFVWLQTMSSVQTTFLPAPVCSCCACKKTDCCVSAATPEAQPLAATPANNHSQSEFSLFAPALVTWTLPVIELSQIPASDSAPFLALAVPLFTRHCALLI
jgi:hypothetical protein